MLHLREKPQNVGGAQSTGGAAESGFLSMVFLGFFYVFFFLKYGFVGFFSKVFYF